jgi:hypothetical protein
MVGHRLDIRSINFKTALGTGSNIDSLPYDLVKKIILHTPTHGEVEKWKDRVRTAINEVFAPRIGEFDNLIYMVIKKHMENVVNQIDTPNVQLIKYGKEMITESLMSFTELMKSIGNGKKEKNLNTLQFGPTPSKSITINDIIATIKAYRLEGK